MLFMIDQLNRFKQYAHRAMSRIEEWKNNRDTQVECIAEEIQGAFAEGYYTAMGEVHSTPWELLLVHLYRGTGRGTIETAMDVVDARLAEGWEPWQVGGADKAFLIMRRRKAVSDEQKTLNANSN